MWKVEKQKLLVRFRPYLRTLRAIAEAPKADSVFTISVCQKPGVEADC